MRETIRALRDRRLLLVLDNFEHLLGAASDIATLMSTCPELVDPGHKPGAIAYPRRAGSGGHAAASA